MEKKDGGKMKRIKEETINCTLREGPPELSALFICLSVYMLVCHFVIICHISLGGMQDHTIFGMRRGGEETWGFATR